jgi:hypothetical protein
MLLDYSTNSLKLKGPKPSTALEAYWLQPELGRSFTGLHVNVRRLTEIIGVEEEAV